jgi:hypothetical protein
MARALTPILMTKAFVLRMLIGSASHDLQSSMVVGSDEVRDFGDTVAE